MSNTKNQGLSRLMSLPEAAKLLGMSKDLLRYYVKNERGPRHDLVAGRYIFDPADLEGWVPVPQRRGRPK